MSRQAIIDALAVRLQAMPQLPDIAWEGGAPYLPEIGRLYLSGRLSGYTRTPAGAGADTPMLESAMLTVNVVAPADAGGAAAGRMADGVAAYFRRGTVLVLSTGQALTIENASAQPAQSSGDWLTIPVLVQAGATDP